MGLDSPLMIGAQHVGFLIFLMRGRVKSGFELEITCFNDTMRNYRLSQKLKLLGNGEFNHLIDILTISTHKLKPMHLDPTM